VIEAQARVVAVEPGYAWVESERRSGCSHCTSSDTCGVSSLGKLFGVQRVHMRLPDPLGMRPGDNVVIGLSERRLVAAALAAYMLPLLVMIVIALLGTQLGQGQVTLALSSFAGLAAGLWLVKARANRQETADRYQPVLLRQHPAGECAIEIEPLVRGADHE
jgi:sigma-E factor negative regulatory protein RseC